MGEITDRDYRRRTARAAAAAAVDRVSEDIVHFEAVELSGRLYGLLADHLGVAPLDAEPDPGYTPDRSAGGGGEKDSKMNGSEKHGGAQGRLGTLAEGTCAVTGTPLHEEGELFGGVGEAAGFLGYCSCGWYRFKLSPPERACPVCGSSAPATRPAFEPQGCCREWPAGEETMTNRSGGSLNNPQGAPRGTGGEAPEAARLRFFIRDLLSDLDETGEANCADIQALAQEHGLLDEEFAFTPLALGGEAGGLRSREAPEGSLKRAAEAMGEIWRRGWRSASLTGAAPGPLRLRRWEAKDGGDRLVASFVGADGGLVVLTLAKGEGTTMDAEQVLAGAGDGFEWTVTIGDRVCRSEIELQVAVDDLMDRAETRLHEALKGMISDPKLVKVWTPRAACASASPFEHDQDDTVLVWYDDLLELWELGQAVRLWSDQPHDGQAVADLLTAYARATGGLPRSSAMPDWTRYHPGFQDELGLQEPVDPEDPSLPALVATPKRYRRGSVNLAVLGLDGQFHQRLDVPWVEAGEEPPQGESWAGPAQRVDSDQPEDATHPHPEEAP